MGEGGTCIFQMEHRIPWVPQKSSCSEMAFWPWPSSFGEGILKINGENFVPKPLRSTHRHITCESVSTDSFQIWRESRWTLCWKQCWLKHQQRWCHMENLLFLYRGMQFSLDWNLCMCAPQITERRPLLNIMIIGHYGKDIHKQKWNVNKYTWKMFCSLFSDACIWGSGGRFCPLGVVVDKKTAGFVSALRSLLVILQTARVASFPGLLHL